MPKLHKIRTKIEGFVQNINVNIAIAIENNERQLVQMNRQQMLDSKDSTGKPLIHKQTGSEYLSPAYARMTGKRKPDLHLTGDFQSEMFLDVNELKMQYMIDSEDEKSGLLVENYGKNIFGVPAMRRNEAKLMNLKSFAKLFKLKVLK